MSTSFWIDSDEEWDDDIYSSEDSGSDKDEVKHHSKFADLDIDEDEEDDKRVTRSAQEKSWEDLTKSTKVLRNKMFINDWNLASTEWENMKKIVAKSEPVFVKDGIPKFLTSFLLELEDRLNEMFADKAFKKNAAPTNARSLNTMRQGFKKWLLANADQTARISAFRANPKLAEEEEPVKKATGAKKSGNKVVAKESAVASSGASGWSLAGAKDEGASVATKATKLQGRSKWLKRADAGDSDDSSSSSSDDDDDASWLDDEEDGDGEDALVASVAGRKRHEGGKDAKKNVKPKAGSKPGVDGESEGESDEDEEGEKSESAEKAKAAAEKAQEWTAEKIDQKLKELVARRGTRNYDRVKQVLLFAFLLEKSKEKAYTVERHLRILFALIDSLFDVNTNMYMHMNVKLWKYTYNIIVKAFELMAANEATISIVEAEPLVPAGQVFATDAAGLILVRGMLLSVLERLDEEYFKSVQIMDPHTQDYIARMRHEPALLRLLTLGFHYFTSAGEAQKAAHIAARRLDHLYYRRDSDSPASQRAALRDAQRALLEDSQFLKDQRQKDDALLAEVEGSDKLSASSASINAEDATQVAVNAMNEIPDEELLALEVVFVAGILKTAVDASSVSVQDLTTGAKAGQGCAFACAAYLASLSGEESNLVELVPRLCGLVYKSNDERLRIRAVLQHIYHLALHDKYFEARDRMLATRLQDEIVNANDPSMHILFNRALVQLGLGAFRKGRIVDAHSALAEIVGPRLKELLAQGLVILRNVERTAEQEKLEKRRQMPYPMHINIDLIEYVHLTSAMLLEVPNMAASVYDARKRPISKTFRKTIDNSDRQTFTGPPENTKDHVIAASKALIQADWQLASSLLLNLDIWKLIPKADEVKTMLKRKIQEEALRTHLFSNAHFYETIKLDQLVHQFQLPKHSVHAITSRMMIHDELPGASWDQPSESILFSSHLLHSHAHAHLHHLSLQYADRISNLFDSSDADGRDSRSGGSGPDGSRTDSSASGQAGHQNQHQGSGSGTGGNSQKRGNQSGDRNFSGKKDYYHKGGASSNKQGGKPMKRRN